MWARMVDAKHKSLNHILGLLVALTLPPERAHGMSLSLVPLII